MVVTTLPAATETPCVARGPRSEIDSLATRRMRVTPSGGGRPRADGAACAGGRSRAHSFSSGASRPHPLWRPEGRSGGSRWRDPPLGRLRRASPIRHTGFRFMWRMGTASDGRQPTTPPPGEGKGRIYAPAPHGRYRGRDHLRVPARRRRRHRFGTGHAPVREEGPRERRGEERQDSSPAPTRSSGSSPARTAPWRSAR